ncbi:MAG: ROK family glucokinase [Kineosporiaceae bacterium]
MDLTIGVDVGGTKIAAGVVDVEGRILAEVRVPTPGASAEAVEDGIVEAVTQLRTSFEVVGAGVALPGFVDEKRATLRFTPNLPMRERPLREILSPRLGLPVVIENDANAAAWGEYRFGGGRGVKDMCLTTVGTGLGGGIVIDGHLVRGAWGSGAEFGHVRVVPDGHLCGCGKRGCWEQYCSGRALGREGRRAAAENPDAAAAILAKAGGDPAAVEGWMVSVSAREGDPLAISLLGEVGRWLGEGIADLADLLDPEVVVVGGGVIETGELLLGPARIAYEAQLSASAYRPHLRIVAAELGTSAGLIGAADLARVP